MGTVSKMSSAQKQTLYNSNNWSQWLPFPDPSNKGVICAPFGPGVYQLRNKKTNEFVLFGMGENVAERMTSLLPDQVNSAKRKNIGKKDYVRDYLPDIEYRTMALANAADATAFETFIKEQENYIFNS